MKCSFDKSVEGSVFGWLKRQRRADPREGEELIASWTPGDVFPWPKGVVLTAVDELILALPMAMFEPDRPMGEFLFGPSEMQVNIPAQGDSFRVRLTPGMSLSLARSVKAYLIADNARPRRVRVTKAR